MSQPAQVLPPELWPDVAAELAVRRARQHFHVFGQTVCLDNAGQALVYSEIHFAWIAHINYCWSHGLHAGIFAPFGHGKSSGLAVPLLAFLLGRDQRRRIKVVCSADKAAAQRVSLARQILESPAYRRVFPGVRPGYKWTEHMLYAARVGQAIDPSIEARGVFTKGVGSRATEILFDDVVDLANSMEVKSRERVKTYVMKQWMSRLEPNGHALWIATPWAADDASFMMKAQSDWCWLEHRVHEEAPGVYTSYEQEVTNAGPDYEEYVETNIVDMLGRPMNPA